MMMRVIHIVLYNILLFWYTIINILLYNLLCLLPLLLHRHRRHRHFDQDWSLFLVARYSRSFGQDWSWFLVARYSRSFDQDWSWFHVARSSRTFCQDWSWFLVARSSRTFCQDERLPPALSVQYSVQLCSHRFSLLQRSSMGSALFPSFKDLQLFIDIFLLASAIFVVSNTQQQWPLFSQRSS